MGSASCALPLDGDAVFVPGVGFRPAEVAIARVPVTREHAGRTITVERAAAGPDGTEVVLSDTGLCEWDNTQMAPWANDPVRLRDGSGHVFGQRGWRGGTGRRGSKDDPRIQMIQRELTLEPLPAGTRRSPHRPPRPPGCVPGTARLSSYRRVPAADGQSIEIPYLTDRGIGC